MSFGHILGRLNSSSTGLSYLDQFDVSAGASSTTYYSSSTLNFATRLVVFYAPISVPSATVVPAYPSVGTSLGGGSAVVYLSGGNTDVRVLVFLG